VIGLELIDACRDRAARARVVDILQEVPGILRSFSRNAYHPEMSVGDKRGRQPEVREYNVIILNAPRQPLISLRFRPGDVRAGRHGRGLNRKREYAEYHHDDRDRIYVQILSPGSKA
jgi:hypothetical protein